MLGTDSWALRISWLSDLQASHLRLLSAHLRHVDESHSQGLIAQDGPVLVPLPPLQHDLQLVGISLKEMRVLGAQRESRQLLSHQVLVGCGGLGSCYRTQPLCASVSTICAGGGQGRKKCWRGWLWCLVPDSPVVLGSTQFQNCLFPCHLVRCFLHVFQYGLLDNGERCAGG